MVIVAIVAIDFGAVRAMFTSTGIGTHFIMMLIMGTLPMANVLLAGFLAGHLRGRYTPFLTGFEASGATALVIYLASIWRFSHAIERIFLSPLLQPMVDNLRRKPHAAPWDIAIIYISGAAILALPQLGFALIGGSHFHTIAAVRTRVKEIPPSSCP
jgi:hypothetical protein